MRDNQYRAQFVLDALGPYRLEYTAWALRRRQHNALDRWDGHEYSRVLIVDNCAIKVTARQRDVVAGDSIVGTLCAQTPIGPQAQRVAQSLVRSMLGLSIDLHPFYNLAEDDPIIGSLVRRFRGVKPPRFPTAFEALANAIACQQVSLDVAILLLNRLSEAFGRPFDDGGETMHAFPEPQDLANASEDDVRGVGLSRRKAQTIQEVATVFANASEVPNFDSMTVVQIQQLLTSMRGIGRWSSEYVLLRGLGRLAIFPGDDVGAQNNLQRLFDLDHRPDYAAIERLVSRWHPYQGLVYFHLLLERLVARGVL